MPAKLSVSIVAYNNYKEIEEAIASMEKYTSSKLTKIVYIIDNGVSISSKEIVDEFKQYISLYEDIRYIDVGENIGFGRGHNLVLDRLESEFHAIVNPDILFCEDAFLNIIEWMNENLEVGMVIPLITDENGNRQDAYRKELTVFDMANRMLFKGAFSERAKKHSLQFMDYEKPFQVAFGQGSFLVIRSDLFKSLKGFDENFFMYIEDADLCKRVNQVSRLMFYPGAKVLHKWGKGSHKNIPLFWFHLKSMIYYFGKWGWKLF